MQVKHPPGSDRIPTVNSAVRNFQPEDGVSTLPIVDISAFYSDDPVAKLNVGRQIGITVMKTGFLYVENHSVSQQLIDQVYEYVRIFFALDEQEKLRYYIGNSPNHRGFVPVTEKGDYGDEPGDRSYEAFDMSLDMSYADYLKCKPNPLSGPNVWPEVAGFRACLTRYYNEIRRLGDCLCEAFEIALNMPAGFFGKHMKHPTSQLRLIHYIPQSKRQRQVYMGAHTDYECFTLLHTQQQGLQFLDKSNQWVDAPLIEGAFLVNIGDLLEAWSNGRFVATPHRVVTDGTERYSIPFFMSTDYETVIEPIRRANGKGKSDKYAPFVAGEHLMGQLLRDFPYLKKRYENGEIDLKDGMPKKNPFEKRIVQFESQDEIELSTP
jgi:isopenicillin N synthase-like dioxygenase